VQASAVTGWDAGTPAGVEAAEVVSVGPVRRRWLAFYAVGALGMVVQLTTVWVLTTWTGMGYLAGTAIGVEAAVLHNFAWHERWTWADRAAVSGRSTLGRLTRFNAANGLLSIWGNVAFTALFVTLGTGYVAGNLMAIAACSALNFLAADRLVFAPRV
jgi:putative flippase GtrA